MNSELFAKKYISAAALPAFRVLLDNEVAQTGDVVINRATTIADVWCGFMVNQIHKYTSGYESHKCTIISDDTKGNTAQYIKTIDGNPTEVIRFNFSGEENFKPAHAWERKIEYNYCWTKIIAALQCYNDLKDEIVPPGKYSSWSSAKRRLHPVASRPLPLP